MPAKTYIYFSTFGSMPFEHEVDFGATFTYGISTYPTEMPDISTSHGTHYRSLKPLTTQEAADQLIGKLKEKAADAPTLHQIMLSTLSSGLAKLHASRAPILALPGVLPALNMTIATVNAVLAVPAAPVAEVVEFAAAWGIRGQVHALEVQVAELVRSNAALTVRVAALANHTNGEAS